MNQGFVYVTRMGDCLKKAWGEVLFRSMIVMEEAESWSSPTSVYDNRTNLIIVLKKHV